MYFPDFLLRTKVIDDWTGTRIVEEEISFSALADVVVEERRLVHVAHDNPVRSRLVRPVLTIDIPYVDGTDLETLAKIAADNADSVARFRDFMRSRLLDFDARQSAEHLDEEAVKLAVDITTGVRDFDVDLRRLKRTRAFQASGGVIASIAATLVAINGELFGALPTAIGAGGGLWALAKAVDEYYDGLSHIRSRPLFYMWLLHAGGTSLRSAS